MFRQRFIVLIAVLALCWVQVSAQTEPELNPYPAGESLTYIGKFKRFGFSFAIAEMDFKVMETAPDGHHYVVTEANSKGNLARLFNFKFYIKIDSIIDREKFHVEQTKKRDEQGDRIRNSEADFDYEYERVVYTETDPNNPTKAPRRVASEIGPDTQDIVSAVYKLRSLDLAVGKSFNFKVSDSGLVYDIPVKVTAREQIKSELGKRWCWRIDPEIFGPGRIIEREGSLVIWITDDEDRVPVLAKLDTKLGDVEIKLREFANLRTHARESKQAIID